MCIRDSHIHVEVVTEEITFPMGVPSPVTSRLGIMTFTITGRAAIFRAIANPFFPLLGGGADRGPVTGKSQMFRVNKSLRAGKGHNKTRTSPAGHRPCRWSAVQRTTHTLIVS